MNKQPQNYLHFCKMARDLTTNLTKNGGFKMIDPNMVPSTVSDNSYGQFRNCLERLAIELWAQTYIDEDWSYDAQNRPDLVSENHQIEFKSTFSNLERGAVCYERDDMDLPPLIKDEFETYPIGQFPNLVMCLLSLNPEHFRREKAWVKNYDLLDMFYLLCKRSLEQQGGFQNINKKDIPKDFAKLKEFTKTKSHWTDEIIDPSNYLEIEEMKKSFIAEHPRMEDWINHKYLPGQEIPDLIDVNRKVTCDQDKPFDGKGRAPFLLHMPFYLEALDMETELKNIPPSVLNDQNWLEFVRLQHFNKHYSGTLAHIKKLNLYIARLQQGIAIRDLRTEIDELLGYKTRRRNKQEVIELLAQAIWIETSTLDNTNNNFNVKATTKGKFAFGMKSSLLTEGKVRMPKSDKVYYQNETGIYDYFTENNYEEEMRDLVFNPVNLDRPDLTDSYISAADKQKIVNDLDEKGKEHFEKMTNTMWVSAGYRKARFDDTLLGDIPVCKKAGSKTESIYAGACPVTQIGYMSTPCISNSQGGALRMYGVYNAKDFINQETGLPPEWVGPIVWKIVGDKVYVRTKTVRLNWKAVTHSFSTFIGFLGTAETSSIIGQNLIESNLFGTFSWNFTRGLKKALDIVYLLDKNIYFGGTFGRDQAKEKLNPLIINDIRVSTVIARYKKDYKEWHKETIDFVSKGENKFPGLIHPVFKCKVENWDSLHQICYAKQLLPAEDGGNQISLMRGFFKKELKLEENIFNSPFKNKKNGKGLNWKKSLPINKFFDKLMTNENKDWLPYAYHPDLCYRMWEKFGRIAVEKSNAGKLTHPTYKYTEEKSLETGKPTSSVITWKLDWYDISDEDWQQKLLDKRRIIGATTVSTNEALLFEEIHYNSLESSFTKMSIMELSACQLTDYPLNCIVLPRPKQQSDYDKRMFFIQMIHSRNVNKLWDECMRELLFCTDSDILLAKGLDKNIKIQEGMEKVGTRAGLMSTTEDQTRYGDAYSVESMIIALHALRNVGYLTEDLYVLFREAAEQLRNRVVLVPPEILKQLETVTGEGDSRLDKEIQEIKLMLQRNHQLTDVNVDSIRSKTAFADIISDFVFYRMYGGVLGVFNVLWSVFSSQIKWFSGECLNFVTGRGGEKNSLMKAKTHSDDSMCHTKLPVPEDELFKTKCVTDLFEKIKKLENKYIDEDDRIIIDSYPKTTDGVTTEKIVLKALYGTFTRTTDINFTVLSKFFLCINMFSARPFSQRPSEMKCSFGYVAEMIQQIHTSDKQIFVPQVRYVCKIAADLPSTSFANDLLSSCSRVYDVISHMGTELVCHELLILANIFISIRYGYPIKDRSSNIPPELGGIFYFLPTGIAKFGYQSNRGRLIANSTVLPNLENLFKLMINVADNWQIKRDRTMGEVTVVETDESSGAPEVLKDFILVWSSKVQADAGYNRILDIGTKYMKRAFLNKDVFGIWPFNSEKTDHQIMTDLSEEFKLFKGVGQNNAAVSMLEFLDRMKNPGFVSEYKKLSSDIQIVNRKGWLKRGMRNPLSKILCQKSGLTSNSTEIKLVIDALVSLSKGFLEYSPLIEKSWKLIKTKYQESTNWVLYTELVLGEPVEKIEVSTAYVSIKNDRTTYLDPKLCEEALFRISLDSADDQKRMKDLKEFTRVKTFVHNTLDLYIGHFLIILETLDITKTKDIIRHKRLIVALGMSNQFQGIIKLPNGDNIDNRWNFCMGDGNHYRITLKDNKPIVTQSYRLPSINTSSLAPIINASLCQANIMSAKLIDLKFIIRDEVTLIDKKELFYEHLDKFNDRQLKQWSSDMLTILLMNNCFQECLSCQRIMTKDKSTVKLKIFNLYAFEMTFEGSWSCKISTTLTPPGISFEKFLSALLCFSSRCFLSHVKEACDSYKGLARTKLENINGNYYFYAWKTSLEHGTNPSNFHSLIKMELDPLLSVDETEVEYYPNMILFKEQWKDNNITTKRNYYVSPWFQHEVVQGLDSLLFLVKDNIPMNRLKMTHEVIYMDYFITDFVFINYEFLEEPSIVTKGALTSCLKFFQLNLQFNNKPLTAEELYYTLQFHELQGLKEKTYISTLTIVEFLCSDIKAGEKLSMKFHEKRIEFEPDNEFREIVTLYHAAVELINIYTNVLFKLPKSLGIKVKKDLVVKDTETDYYLKIEIMDNMEKVTPLIKQVVSKEDSMAIFSASLDSSGIKMPLRNFEQLLKYFPGGNFYQTVTSNKFNKVVGYPDYEDKNSIFLPVFLTVKRGLPLDSLLSRVWELVGKFEPKK